MTDPRPVPLARLFAMGYRYLVDRMHTRLRELGWTDVAPSFGFLLLAARDGPTTATEIAHLMRSTKQAASKLIEAMESAGYVQRQAHEADGRVKVVALSERGRRLLAEVEGIYAEQEAEWADLLGQAEIEALRHYLVTALRHAYGDVLPALGPPGVPAGGHVAPVRREAPPAG